MIVLVVLLAMVTALLSGMTIGAWLALQWVRHLRPGREGDLIAELGALRASAGLHQAALVAQRSMFETAGEQS